MSGNPGCSANGSSQTNKALLEDMIARWDRKAPAPELVLQAKIETEIAQGLSLLHWSWRIPGPYNGSSGEQRIKGWQITKVALARRWLDPAACCSICTAPPPVQRHSELYGRPLLAKPICRQCHFAIHRRFRKPKAWQAICERQPTEHWIRRLPLVELISSEARDLEAQLNPLGLLDPS